MKLFTVIRKGSLHLLKYLTSIKFPRGGNCMAVGLAQGSGLSDCLKGGESSAGQLMVRCTPFGTLGSALGDQYHNRTRSLKNESSKIVSEKKEIYLLILGLDFSLLFNILGPCQNTAKDEKNIALKVIQSMQDRYRKRRKVAEMHCFSINQFSIICNESSFFPDSSEMNASSAWSADFPRTKPITKRT